MHNVFAPAEEQLRVLERGVVDLVERADLLDRVERSRRDGRPLRVKLGIDPSSPDIHVGHAVVLRKLRDFQLLGHQVVVLWGTATAMLGDPTGKNRTRPTLTREQVDANKATYKAQIGRVLDLSSIEERENGEWFDAMSFMDGVRLAAGATVARMLERDSFEKRYKAGEPISVHELLYPLMQGWDSVELRADVEIGGTDQLFNLHMGRELQRREGQEPQICLTTPILTGLDGVEKMSKSLGNYVGVSEPPREMFGKCMSVPDDKMREWFTLSTDVPLAQVDALLAGHPRAAKVALARAVTELYHGADAARAAVEEFDRMFRHGGTPDEMPEVAIALRDAGDGTRVDLTAVLVEVGFCASRSEARRLIQGGGVRVEGEKITDVHHQLPAGVFHVQAGKRKHARASID